MDKWWVAGVLGAGLFVAAVPAQADPTDGPTARSNNKSYAYWLDKQGVVYLAFTKNYRINGTRVAVLTVSRQPGAGGTIRDNVFDCGNPQRVASIVVGFEDASGAVRWLDEKEVEVPKFKEIDPLTTLFSAHPEYRDQLGMLSGMVCRGEVGILSNNHNPVVPLAEFEQNLKDTDSVLSKGK